MLERDPFDEADVSEAELIRRYRTGDQSAFHQLAGRYFLKLRKRAAGMAGGTTDPEDLVQEGLIGLLNAVRTYDPESGASFRTYAEVCVRHRMISLVRSSCSGKNRINAVASSIEEAGCLPGAPEDDPQNAMVLQEDFRALESYLQQHLSVTESAVLERYLQGKSYDEIASELKVSRKSCDNAMQRVRQKLRRRP